MSRGVKHKLNAQVYDLLKPTYFDTIQLGAIMNILEESGYTILQEDMTPWDGIICGREGHEYFTIGVKDRDKWVEIGNAMLSLSWYKMESGRYEVVGYIT